MAQLRGHGGPVRALTISADGKTLLSGSFDGSAIRWSLERDEAAAGAAVSRRCGQRHGAVQGRPRSDRRRRRPHCNLESGKPQPDRVFEGHTAPVAAIAISADGTMLASASWDHSVRLWPVAGGAPRLFEGHTQNVNGVAFSADGRALVTASYDLTLRIWPLDGAAPPSSRCPRR